MEIRGWEYENKRIEICWDMWYKKFGRVRNGDKKWGIINFCCMLLVW